jgi:hypothetical protein
VDRSKAPAIANNVLDIVRAIYSSENNNETRIGVPPIRANLNQQSAIY